jgi:endogenous inhibitor of DNA gyrase (YacG/DUF329 family)
MAKKKVRSLRCPICRKIVLRSEPEFPFCSERCRLIDLGKWASGGYVISTPVTDPEMLESAATESNPQDLHRSKEDNDRRRQ